MRIIDQTDTVLEKPMWLQLCNVFAAVWCAELLTLASASARPAPAPKAGSDNPPPMVEARPPEPVMLTGPASPEDAIIQLNATVIALRDGKGSIGAVLALFDDSMAEPLRQMFRLSARMAESHTRLKTAMENRFGPEHKSTPSPLPDLSNYEQRFREGLRELVSLQLDGQPEPAADGRFVLTVKSERKPNKEASEPRQRKDRLFAVRQPDGSWRLLFESLNDPKMLRLLQIQVETFRHAPAALDRIAIEISEGRHKTRAEAQQAAFSALLGVMLNSEQKIP